MTAKFPENKPTENKCDSNTTEKKSKRQFKVQISYIDPKRDTEWSKTVTCLQVFKFFMICVVLSFMIFAIWTVVRSIINDDGDVVDVHVIDVDVIHGNDIEHPSEKLQLVSRQMWLAQPPTDELTPLRTPVSLIIIHHTASENCTTLSQCIFLTRQIQMFHIEDRSFSDIAYNFLVGGDGKVYEGRGWTSQGAHTLNYNRLSLGVGFIGTFINEVPSEDQIRAFQNLLKEGERLGYLKEDYYILGGRQCSATQSPGDAFFEVIKTWDHWTENYNITES